MIRHASHIRPATDAIKIGGHQTSSASMVLIMAALYFSALTTRAAWPPPDPAAAAQYLMGNLSRENMENFRGFGGGQSCPPQIKDTDDADFSNGSVGLGVAVMPFASIIQLHCQLGLGRGRARRPHGSARWRRGT